MKRKGGKEKQEKKRSKRSHTTKERQKEEGRRRPQSYRRRKATQPEGGEVGRGSPPLRASTLSALRSVTMETPWVRRLTQMGSPQRLSSSPPVDRRAIDDLQRAFRADITQRHVIAKTKCESVEEKGVVHGDYFEEVGSITCLLACNKPIKFDDKPTAVIGGSEKGFLLFWDAEVFIYIFLFLNLSFSFRLPSSIT